MLKIRKNKTSTMDSSSQLFKHILSSPCDTTAAATRRYALFLEEAAAGQLTTTVMNHVWPAALTMNVFPSSADAAPRFAAIAHLENMESELAALLRLAGHTNLNLAPLQGHRHSHAADPCVANVDPSDPRVMKNFCQLYDADYACFDYDVPAACKGKKVKNG